MLPTWDEMAVVGRIARAHGLRGQVILDVETDFPDERFRPGAELFIRRGDRIEPIRIASVRFHRDRPVIGMAGIGDVTSASELAGSELRVPVERLSALPIGTYYRHDLIGCGVEGRGGERIGVVSNVEGTAAGSRLVVDTPAGQVLVPLASEICRVIDPTAKRIAIDPPAGLLELNERPAGRARERARKRSHA